MNCKYCQSESVVKFGKYKDVQLYWCKECERKFKDDDNLFGMAKPPNYITSAINMYYTGMSIGDISKFMYQEYKYAPSKSVIFNWVNKYTDKAVERYRDERPKVGDTWIADETYLDVDGGRKIFFWDVIDADTRYLLATRASYTRSTKDAQSVLEQAAWRAGKKPKLLLTDKYRAYVDGAELAFGYDSEHKQSSPFAIAEDSTSKIERFHGTLKDRLKVMRAFRDIETLIQFTNGFAVFYNHFRPHDALNNKTPAEVAGLESSVKNWGDLCRVPVSKSEAIEVRIIPFPKVKKVRTPVVRVKRKKMVRKDPFLSTAGIKIEKELHIVRGKRR